MFLSRFSAHCQKTMLCLVAHLSHVDTVEGFFKLDPVALTITAVTAWFGVRHAAGAS